MHGNSAALPPEPLAPADDVALMACNPPTQQMLSFPLPQFVIGERILFLLTSFILLTPLELGGERDSKSLVFFDTGRDQRAKLDPWGIGATPDPQARPASRVYLVLQERKEPR